MTTPDKDPISIGRVTLTVRDLDRVRDFYQRVIGLSVLAGDAGSATLGAGSRPLLELRKDAGARVRSPREAGLFHTAFLLPMRGDLGRWLKHVIETKVPLQGASDHIVSEAAYLSDPEGNGIEVYSDRPRESWEWTSGQVRMSTDPMDVDGVIKAGAGKWSDAPDGTIVGHVHLQVGALAPAEDFYAGSLGFEVTTHYPGATFFGAGGYHHHLAANIWNSRNAGPRDFPSTGLAEVELIAPGADLREAADPWGTKFSVRS